MRNEKKKKNNEGQPRARFLPFSQKNASRLARRKKDLPSSALVVVVVVSSKRFVCFVEILSLSLSTIIVFSFFPFFRRLFSLWGENTHFLNPRVIMETLNIGTEEKREKER